MSSVFITISIAYLIVPWPFIIFPSIQPGSLVWHKQSLVGFSPLLSILSKGTSIGLEFHVILSELMRSQDCVHAARGMTRGEASYLSNLGPSAVVPGPIPFKAAWQSAVQSIRD
jgi:hypothetical protein